MNIQSISAVNYANHISRNNVAVKKQEAPQPQAQTSFDGIWTRMSRSYIDKTSFAIRGYYPYIDGVVPTKTHDDEGRIIVPLNDNGMTTHEGKLAVDFIANGKTNYANYDAAKKLSRFMNETVDEYTPMFMEVEDKADETKATQKIHLTHHQLNKLISDYEYEHGIKERPLYKEDDEVQELMTPEEFLKKLTEDGIA
ncbi:hypothetical protein IJI31_04455 [bacterium]|nr:hypothetical protein [bacterium]